MNAAVLVKLDVDGEAINVVEVKNATGTDSLADTLDEAIAELIVVRDALRKMAVAP